MMRAFRLVALAAVIGLAPAGAGASDFAELRRPEVVRAMFLSPERRTQLLCASALAARKHGPGDRAFIAAVKDRVAAEIGSREEVDRLFVKRRQQMGMRDDRSAEQATAVSMACHALGPARTASPSELARLLGPVPKKAIPLPTAPECLAAFEADRLNNPPGNDLAADMIEHFSTKLASDDQARAELEDWRKRFAASPPDASRVEVLSVSCLPAAAALANQP